jgi:hypothetical protein
MSTARSLSTRDQRRQRRRITTGVHDVVADGAKNVFLIADRGRQILRRRDRPALRTPRQDTSRHPDVAWVQYQVSHRTPP